MLFWNPRFPHILWVPMKTRHIAQFNVSRLRHGHDDPRLLSFGIGANMVRRAVAKAPGHIWNQQDILPGDLFATRSVWESIDALREFVFSGIHERYRRRSAVWFVPMDERNHVLWRIEAGEQPTLDESQRRLDVLRAEGPSEAAFDFSQASLGKR